jgi:two-component system, response regulator PdtaR
VVETRVVIADDEPIIRMGLREMLEEQGYIVVGEATDGQTAVDLAREARPDVVVMDIRMPGVDGISAAGILTQERIAPIILITAFYDRELVERARDAGVFSYVRKPFNESQLVPQIELALARFAEYQSLVKEAGDAKIAMETRKLVERAKGMLMKAHNVDEAEAYRRIQRMSMNSRKPMKDIAEAILMTVHPD